MHKYYTKFKKEVSTDYYYINYKGEKYSVEDFAKKLFFSEKEFENCRNHNFAPSTITFITDSLTMSEEIDFSVELDLLHPLFETEKDLVVGYIPYLKLPKITFVTTKCEILEDVLHIDLKSYSVECPNYDEYYSNLYIRYHAIIPEKQKKDAYNREEIISMFEEIKGIKLSEEERSKVMKTTEDIMEKLNEDENNGVKGILEIFKGSETQIIGISPEKINKK